MEIFAALGEAVFHVERDFAENLFFDHPISYQFIETSGEGAGADACERDEKLTETFLAMEKIADDEHRPLLADDGESFFYRTRRLIFLS